ncbi:MAG: hypothetical protein JWM78_475 [Verrucomicrobiaceae bacterium]|nr:hypothetical protein [Verrucomicrobiaceae bacterium]
MWKRLLVIALIAWGAHSWWAKREMMHGPGVLAPEAPVQSGATHTRTFDFNGYRITPLADYSITARVLSREDYHIGREADLSNTDFALGWGRMSDESVLKAISINQSGRFYFWQVEELPIPQREIETSSANVHLIAADKNIARQIGAIRKGQIVHLQGELVRADAADGWRWVSSLTRDDTGAGACELFFVERVDPQ